FRIVAHNVVPKSDDNASAAKMFPSEGNFFRSDAFRVFFIYALSSSLRGRINQHELVRTNCPTPSLSAAVFTGGLGIADQRGRAWGGNPGGTDRRHVDLSPGVGRPHCIV